MKKFSILFMIVAMFMFGACNSSENESSANNEKSETSEEKNTEIQKVEEAQTAQNRKAEEAQISKTLTNADIPKYIKDNNITVEPTPTGLYYVVKEEGTGDKVKTGDIVSVHYSGTLLDGKKFDSSYDRGVPFDFQIGSGSVIAGWDEGIALMKVGEKAKLIIPSELAYGDKAVGGVIPANSPLIFDVELVEIKKK